MMDDVAIRIFDIIFAVFLIVLLLPLMILAVGLIVLFVGFPPFYTACRVGRDGIEYRHYKLKSMRQGRETGRIFFEKDRLNWCGKLLRRLHLDELPELLHILSGRMSFVGPRPLPRSLMIGLDTSIRETVRPGWTGPAQVHLLRHGQLDKRRQIELDNRYVQKRSFFFNLKIMAETLTGMLKRQGPDLNPEATADRVRFKENL